MPFDLTSSPVAPGIRGFQPCDFIDATCRANFGLTAWMANPEATGSYYFNSGRYSTLEWLLGPGSYQLTFALTAPAPDINDNFDGDFQTAGLAGSSRRCRSGARIVAAAGYGHRRPGRQAAEDELGPVRRDLRPQETA